MSLDNGYMSGNNLESFDGKEIDVYVATGKGEKKDQRPIEDSNRKIKKVDFNYDEGKDCFVCLAGWPVSEYIKAPFRVIKAWEFFDQM